MKKAYTLLEIIIVTIIIAIMIGIFGFYLPNRNDEQIKFGKECSNYIYNGINNSYNKLTKSYSENFSGEMIITTRLFIKTQPNPLLPTPSEIHYIKVENRNENKIKTTSYNYSNNKFTCESTTTPLTRDGYPTYQIQNKSLHNEEIYIKSCIKEKENCIISSKIIFNQAAQKIEQKFCLSFTGDTCNEWEQ